MTGREERKKKFENQINNLIFNKSKLYSDYMSHCFAAGQQPTTTKLYIQTLIMFMEYIENDCTRESVKEILPMDISKYLDHIRTKTVSQDGKEVSVPTSTSYRATSYSALKNFFDFLKENKIIEENPMENMKRPKVTDEVSQQHLDIDQMKEVMFIARNGRRISGKAKTHEINMRSRNVAIMAMLLELGLRCSALITLDLENLDFENKRIIYKDKGEKTFIKPLSDDLIEKLNDWIEDRSRYDLNTEALFVSERKKRCSYNSILKIVKDYTGEIGEPMSVHKMRHSAITAVYDMSNHDVKYTSQYAGHSNLATTNRYINKDYSQQDIEISAKLGSLF